MARYNHFKQDNQPQVNFIDLEIGKRFRTHLWRGKRRESILCVKTGEKTYKEIRNKKEHSYFNPTEIKVMEASLLSSHD